MQKNNTINFWELIHPLIREVSESRFNSKHYSDAVRAATVEIEDRLRTLVKLKIGEELSGVKLVNKALSLNKPLVKLADLSDQIGQNIQLGYMNMLQGTFTGIRNPNSHRNLKLNKLEAIHLLFLCSLFMHKIDLSEKKFINRKKGLDEDILRVAEFAKLNGSISATKIQKTFHFGYARSARILSQLEEQGLITPKDNTSKPRKVLKEKIDKFISKFEPT